MLKVYQTAISFFFFILSLFGNYAYGLESPHRKLVSVFCSELAAYSLGYRELVTSDTFWNKITARLEKRQASNPTSQHLSPSSKIRYEKCIGQFKADFSKAETYLSAQEMAERKPNIQTPPQIEMAQVQAEGLGAFTLRLQPKVLSRHFSGEQEQRRRHAKYRRLWSSFLSELRAKCRKM